MYRPNAWTPKSSSSSQTPPPYYSRILLPKDPPYGHLNSAVKRHHSLINGSSSTSSELSKKSVISTYFSHSKGSSREPSIYMPTLLTFQPQNGYHSPVLRRRMGHTGNVNSVTTPEPPNANIEIERGLRILESKKRAPEHVEVDLNSSFGYGDLAVGCSKRRRTSATRSNTFDILSCINDTDSFSFTSFHQLKSEGLSRKFSPVSMNSSRDKTDEKTSKSVQTLDLNNCSNDFPAHEVEMARIPSSSLPKSNVRLDSAAALRRQIPYMSPCELEAHLLSTKALSYTEYQPTESDSDEESPENFDSLESPIPVISNRKKVNARRALSMNDTKSSAAPTSLNSQPSQITHTVSFDSRMSVNKENSSQPASLARFIANLEDQSLHIPSLSQNVSHLSNGMNRQYSRFSGKFDLDSRIKRIRSLLSKKENDQVSEVSSQLLRESTDKPNLLKTSITSDILKTVTTTTPVSDTLTTPNTSIRFGEVTANAQTPNITTSSEKSVSLTITSTTTTNQSLSLSTTSTTVPFPMFGFTNTTNSSNVQPHILPTISKPGELITSSSVVSVPSLFSGTVNSTATATTTTTILNTPVVPFSFGTLTNASSKNTQIPSMQFTSPVNSGALTISTTTLTTPTMTTALKTSTSVPQSSTELITTSTSATFGLFSTSSECSKPLTASVSLPVFMSSSINQPKPSFTFSTMSSTPNILPIVSIGSSIASSVPVSSTVSLSSASSTLSSQFSFNVSNTKPVSVASPFSFGFSPTVSSTSAPNPVTTSISSFAGHSFGLTIPTVSTQSSLMVPPATSSVNFTFGTSVCKPNESFLNVTSVSSSSSIFGNFGKPLTSFPSTSLNSSGLFQFSPLSSVNSTTTSNTTSSLFNFSSTVTSAASSTAVTTPAFGGFNFASPVTQSSALSTPANQSALSSSANTFKLGFKSTSLPPVSKPLFGGNTQSFNVNTTVSSNQPSFCFGQTVSNNTVASTSSSGFAFNLSGQNTLTSSATAPGQLFQLGTTTSESKASLNNTPTFLFGATPSFSFGPTSQENSLASQPFSGFGLDKTTSLNTNVTNTFQLASTPTFSFPSTTSFSGFNFMSSGNSAPNLTSAVTTVKTQPFVFGQQTNSNPNPFNFGTSPPSSNGSVPTAPRRRPLSSRRSRRP